MSKLDGSDFILSYSTTALTDAADATAKAHTWTEAVDVASVDRTVERAESEFNARSGIIVTVGPLKTALSFLVAYDTADAFYTALLDAIEGKTEIALAATDGDPTTAGSRGVTGNFKVSNFSLNEPDSGPAVSNVSAGSSSYVNANYVAPA